MELKNLLSNVLPLDRVGPHLRHAARRAVRSGDPERMRIVTKVLVAELIRRGDLLKVAVQNDDPTIPAPHYVLIKGTTQLIDLTSLGPIGQPLKLGIPPEATQAEDKPVAPSEPAPPEIDGLNSMLLAMEDAQQLDVSDPRSRESGTILGSILALLAKFTPQFDLHVMVFEETYVSDPHHQVFSRNEQDRRPSWLKVRTPGQSVYMDGPRELPRAIRDRLDPERPVSGAVAVPLFGPAPPGTPLIDRQEAGLLFLLAQGTWEQDTLLRLASRLSRFVTHRWQQHTEMTKLVHIDALTGLFNRGFFDSQFELLLERSRRGNVPLTLILGDIDHFSRVNNDYNHTVGDQALKMVARRLQEELRRIDMIYRVGGEEFALILPNTDLEAAKEVQQRLLDAPMIQHLDSLGNAIDLRITLSYGAVTFPHSGNDAFELYRKADTLLFLSKDRGRNQCHFWSSDGNHAQLLPEVD